MRRGGKGSYCGAALPWTVDCNSSRHLCLMRRPGPYRVEGFDPSGESLFSLNFAIEEVDHGGGNFLFTIPFEDRWRAALERVVLSGPRGMTTVDRESNTPVAILMDRATG